MMMMRFGHGDGRGARLCWLLVVFSVPPPVVSRPKTGGQHRTPLFLRQSRYKIVLGDLKKEQVDPSF